MLEYSIEEAETLLSKNLETATKNLAQIDIDLDYLRDQITTTEVSKCYINSEANLVHCLCLTTIFHFFLDMARAYNWDVKRRQAEKK